MSEEIVEVIAEQMRNVYFADQMHQLGRLSRPQFNQLAMAALAALDKDGWGIVKLADLEKLRELMDQAVKKYSEPTRAIREGDKVEFRDTDGRYGTGTVASIYTLGLTHEQEPYTPEPGRKEGK